MAQQTENPAPTSTPADLRKSAHAIVVGNEKGGSGKSTVAVHIAIALLKAGYHVATIDLDARQKTLTHFIDRRRASAERRYPDLERRFEIEIPDHYCVSEAEGLRRDANEDAERDALIKVVSAVEHSHDFLVIDTPPSDSYLMWLALGMADTLVTPLNGSFVDFDGLGNIDAVTYTLIEPSNYARMVADERRERRKFDHSDIDWVVLSNRRSSLSWNGADELTRALKELGLQLGFRCAEGLTERAVYQDLFPRGLTVLDEIGQSALAKRHRHSRRTARQEIQALIELLKLPLDERSRRHASARVQWFAARDTRLVLDEIVG
jgi:chromosome partitioning protein